MRWTESITEAISFIEDNLTRDITVADIARHVNISPFYFQKGFAMLCDFTVSEYIRCRRLALAAGELAATDAKIIDVAQKYGYDSPDSFAKAFVRFHGCTPSAAGKGGVSIKSFAPLHIKISLEGGNTMEYKIVEKEAFTVVGKGTVVSFDSAYGIIPGLWEKYIQSGDCKLVEGMYGICFSHGDTEFVYMIAGNYMPWEEIPQGFEAKVIPAGTWAVFPSRGALPHSLQEVNTKIWNEWLPNCKDYVLAGDYNIEVYAPPAEKPEDTYCEIWIPVKKK